MKRTEWLPANCKPVRKGLYECKTCFRGMDNDPAAMHYWNGHKWLKYKESDSASMLAPFIWRGLDAPYDAGGAQE